MLFAQEGAQVACVDLDDNAAKATAAQCNDTGNAAIAVTADVAREEDAARTVDEALAAFGAIDIVYANAGIAGSGTAETTTMADWNRVMAVNLTGVWLTSRFALPHMKAAGGGVIINQASVGGLVGVPGIFPYAAAKGGVIGLTRQMAVDFAAHNIRVNAICPGTIPTPLVTDTYAARAQGDAAASQVPVDELVSEASARYPMKRLGEVDDIARAALYLASTDAKWVTGTILTVDGGYTAQ
jgi:NAD(P)-dependent dehydrogenase (short-subunit alcohol dehydrogenase family)